MKRKISGFGLLLAIAFIFGRLGTLAQESAPPTLAPPASLSFAGGTLSWGAVADAQQYIVKWRSVGTSGWPHKAETGTHRYDIPGLQGGQTYEAVVRARAARRRDGESAWSGKFRFTVSVPTAMPLPPTLTPQPPTAMPLPPTLTPPPPTRLPPTLTLPPPTRLPLTLTPPPPTRQPPTLTPPPPTTTPTPVTLASPASLSFAGDTLSWGAVAGAQQYIVKWRLVGTSGWPHKAEVGTHHHHIPGLQGGQTYEAVVRARAARRRDGESAWSGKFRFTVSAPTAMPLPPTLTPQPPTLTPQPTRLPPTLTPLPPTATPTPVILASPASLSFAGGTLSWSAVAGAQQYIVKWRLAGTIGWPHKAEASTHRYDIPRLQGGQTYEAIVRARAARRRYGESAWSGKFRFTVSAPTAMPLPPTPTPLPPTATPTPRPPTATPLPPTPTPLAPLRNIQVSDTGLVTWTGGPAQTGLAYRLHPPAGRANWRRTRRLAGVSSPFQIPGFEQGVSSIKLRLERANGWRQGWDVTRLGSALRSLTPTPTPTPLPPTATPTPRPPTATPLPPTPLPPTPTPLPRLPSPTISSAVVVVFPVFPQIEEQLSIVFRHVPNAIGYEINVYVSGLKSIKVVPLQMLYPTNTRDHYKWYDEIGEFKNANSVTYVRIKALGDGVNYADSEFSPLVQPAGKM